MSVGSLRQQGYRSPLRGGRRAVTVGTFAVVARALHTTRLRHDVLELQPG